MVKEILKYAGSLVVGVVGTILIPKVFKIRAKKDEILIPKVFKIRAKKDEKADKKN